MTSTKDSLTVINTVKRIKNISGNTRTKLIVTPPKSSPSARKIPLPDFIIQLLNDLKAGDKYSLLSGSSSIVDPRTMQYRFKRILSDLNLSSVSFHSLRHFAASALISAGLDVTTVSGALGHCNSGTTSNIYCHILEAARAEVTDA